MGERPGEPSPWWASPEPAVRRSPCRVRLPGQAEGSGCRVRWPMARGTDQLGRPGHESRRSPDCRVQVVGRDLSGCALRRSFLRLRRRLGADLEGGRPRLAPWVVARRALDAITCGLDAAEGGTPVQGSPPLWGVSEFTMEYSDAANEPKMAR